jgi:hypothetical protein
VGDWSLVETIYTSTSTRDTLVEVEKVGDDEKVIYSFMSSNDFVGTLFNKFTDFWLEHTSTGRYGIRGDSVCIVGILGAGEECTQYNVSGNNLTLLDEWGGLRGETYSYTYKLVKGNLANIKKSLGKIYGADPALYSTRWIRSQDSSQIYFSVEGYFRDYDSVYISGEDIVWYTDEGRVFLLELGCDKWELDRYGDKVCVSNTIVNTKIIPYLLDNKTLSLRPPSSSGWDVWTPYENDEDDYYSQPKSKTKSTPERTKRSANPLLRLFGSRF